VILLRVPGTLEYRNLALRAVSEACRIAQHDEWEGASLEAQTVSALGEAFNNIAIHSYAGRPPGDVVVEISWTRDEIVMQITDEGQSFDPDQVELPDLDALPEGGMGLFIIRSFMDEVDYQAGPPNVLRLVKRRGIRAEGEISPMSTRSTPSSAKSATSSKQSAGSGGRGSSSGRSGSIARAPAGADRDSESARSGWRMVAVDGGAATSLRKTGSAEQK
jgi:serine/threonine-protein kinase RsbW